MSFRQAARWSATVYGLAALGGACSGEAPRTGTTTGSEKSEHAEANDDTSGREPTTNGRGSTPSAETKPGKPGATGATTSAPDAARPAPEPIATLIGDVAFSLPSQTFRGELRVALSTTVAGAEIRYTTDGSLPSGSSKLASGELVLTATTQLRAQAFAAGVAGGKPSTALYVARTFDATSNLPIVVIDGYGKAKPTDKNVYKDAAILVFEPADGVASLSALPAVATRAGYHVRGQSSQRLPQTPYRVELWDNAGEDADYPLLGMPSDSDWALIPPYYDRALIRNPLVYELGRELGLGAPRVRFAEVYVNYEARPLAASDYLGVYWITETIKNSGARTDLKQLRDDDTAAPAISGGYIFKFDQAAAEEPKLACTGSTPLSSGFGMGMAGAGFGGMTGTGFGGMTGAGFGGTGGGSSGTCWTDLEVVDPDPLLPEQAAWLKSYLQEFHDSLHETPIGDYGAYIDVASFVDYLIINELTRNVDAYVRSAYYHKDRDGKLKAGPLWDYNFSLAVGGASTIDPAAGFQFRGSRNVNNWYPKLTSDPAFMTRVKARWAELRTGLLADDAMEERITALCEPLREAAVRDYAKWHVADILKPGAFVRGPSAPTWEGQVQALRDFVRARSAFLDSELR